MNKNPSLEELKEMMDEYGSLYLRGTNITSLPDGLTVGGWLDLQGTNITSLPEGLTVGGWLDLRGTNITSLPEGLTVGGGLNLCGTNITSLPEGLTVGGWLDLRETNITSLPEGLTVGGWLYLQGTNLKDTANRLQNGDFVDGRYLYADDMLTHVKRKKKIGNYTFYQGKIPKKNVLFDGENYAHCETFKDGIADLAFKKAKNRGAEQYENLTLKSELGFDDAVSMYRIITGACKQGTQAFVESLKEVKDVYTVEEMIQLTKGQYNSPIFEKFFKGKE